MLEPKDLEMISEIVTKVMEPVRKDIAELREDVAEIKEDITELRRDATELQKDMAGVKLTLENEVRRGINIVCDGHIDLNRKLDMALDIREERERMELRILCLENDMRRVKERIEIA